MFETVLRKVRTLHLTYLGDEKLASLAECLSTVKQREVEGHFLEFGVALGGSGICIASELDGNRSYLGFDVFGMIPPPTDKDGSIPKERYEIIKSGRSEGIGGKQYYGYVEGLKDVAIRNFASCNLPVDDKRIRFVEGLYHDTIPTLPEMKIAFCHIDCDWYEPVLLCLTYVAPRLSDGGIIVLDDYNDWPGCKKATDEFWGSRTDLAFKRKNPHAVLVKAAA
jgi:O-methyltransferase